MEFLNGVLYICLLVVAFIVTWIVFSALVLLFEWLKKCQVKRYNNAGHRFFDRVK